MIPEGCRALVNVLSFALLANFDRGGGIGSTLPTSLLGRSKGGGGCSQVIFVFHDIG